MQLDSMHIVRSACLALLALTGCQSRSEPEPPATPLARSAWSPHGLPLDSLDMGTGIVALPITGDSGRAFPHADTLAFRREPRANAAIVGAMVVSRPEPGGWQYESLLPAGVRPNFMEYAYEESGVPFDSSDANGRWVRGIVGFGAGRTPLHGWASRDTPGLILVSWGEFLAENAVFFLNDSATVLYPTLEDAQARRGGVPIPGKPYTMDIRERRGPWLRMKLRWPYEPCVQPDSSGTKVAEYWARYLDERGRPLVFFHTRGC